MPAPPFEPPAPDIRFRILAIDGGGIRGVIAARVLRRLEELLAEKGGGPLSRHFDLIAGTSTGGLIALALTVPGDDGTPRNTAAELVEMYEGADAREIFHRPFWRKLPVLRRAIDLFFPKYGLGPLERVVRRRLGTEATMAQALGDVMVMAYDMTGRSPRFFKRWSEGAPATKMVDAALATAAAPTFFPPHELEGAALMDGGVYAANPTVAAIVEALKRTESPSPLGPHNLLVVSLGTGHFEVSYQPSMLRRWGAAQWVLPRRGEDPPLIGAILDGQSDAADHWAHVLLNHEPGEPTPPRERLGNGPRYFRYQVDLPAPAQLDDASPEAVAELAAAADRLVGDREAELEALAAALTTDPSGDR